MWHSPGAASAHRHGGTCQESSQRSSRRGLSSAHRLAQQEAEHVLVVREEGPMLELPESAAEVPDHAPRGEPAGGVDRFGGGRHRATLPSSPRAWRAASWAREARMIRRGFSGIGVSSARPFRRSQSARFAARMAGSVTALCSPTPPPAWRGYYDVNPDLGNGEPGGRVSPPRNFTIASKQGGLFQETTRPCFHQDLRPPLPRR